MQPMNSITTGTETPIRVFSTCPAASHVDREYVAHLIEVAQWSEEAGCTGSLIYTDNSLADPWLIAQLVIQNTRRLCPLVAVQPVYMHPYSVATMVSSLAGLHGRPVFLNMVAGGFKNDLVSLDYSTGHDQRYDRLVEYTEIIQNLLAGDSPTTLEGQFYRVKNVVLSPALPESLRGGVLMSGSSPAGLAAARKTGATAIQYPEPPEKRVPVPDGQESGIRVGIIARETEAEAWATAFERFPEDRKGQITRTLATKVSDSDWHRQLAELAEAAKEHRTTYWLRPFENYHTNCPYLVGNYEQVGEEISKYLNLGFRTFILDIPTAKEEFVHIRRVFEMAGAYQTSPTGAVTA